MRYNQFIKNYPEIIVKAIGLIALIATLSHLMLGSGRTTFAQGPTISFSSSGLAGETLNNPTSLQFGPDGRLYVSQQNGTIYAYTIVRNGPNNYQVIKTETIALMINDMQNHDDDGVLNNTKKRQVTGILVTGTGANPVLYITSSDWRIGGGGSGQDTNLDTNSGVFSRLTWDNVQQKWNKVDLVRGLPRSEENHATNGLALDPYTNVLYIAQGGNTNAGSPSNNFAFSTEYALSAAILVVNLNAINALPVQGSGSAQYIYDLPTVDDPTRPNTGPNGADENDPFGGNDGLNQAKIVAGGPVQVYASGFRNPYDLLLTKTPGREGRLYAVDNGANYGWGGYPANEGPAGNCTNEYVVGEPGSTGPGPNDAVVNNKDNLLLITGPGFYGGHPAPIRGNPAGAGLYTHNGTGVWRTSTSGANPLPSDWPPVPVAMADPQQCDFRNPGVNNGAIWTYTSSTNGMAEYSASNFGGALIGNLLFASYNGVVHRVILNQAGNQVTSSQTFASNFGSSPLDIVAQGDNEVFPGTVWAATYGSDNITIFEPSDYDGGSGGVCTGADLPTLDEDTDHYTNADEIDNQSDPCSGAIKPPDNDGDFTSDLNDKDDDNDTINDQTDVFAIDANNGLSTQLPIEYELLNGNPGVGFFGLGLTGLMTNGNDYQQHFDPNNLIAGGAVGLLTIESVPVGDAYQNLNSQAYGFQFGVNVSTATGPFTVRVKTLGNFFQATPTAGQSQGVYIGAGDQDNYLKVVIAGNGGGGIQVLNEQNGAVTHDTFYPISNLLNASVVDLYLTVDPVAGTAQPRYAINGGALANLGAPIPLGGSLLTAVQSPAKALAIGLIASRASNNVPTFGATWDHISVTTGNPGVSNGGWQTVASADGSTPTARHEDAFVAALNKFYLMGGRGNKPVQMFDPVAATWVNAGSAPQELHHFQAVELNGLIYVLGAFQGGFPNETPVPNVYIYNPSNQQWTVGPLIPANRRRGSAGVAVYNNKIYLVAGIQNGHVSGHVPWFDEFDPATNTWTILPDAPRPRDHFQAAIIGNKLYAAGGRNTGLTSTFGDVIGEVDVYDFSTGQWSTLPNKLPTLRAGASVAVLGDELLVIGGESLASTTAHNQTEALNTKTGAWRTLTPLLTGRHGTQAILYNGGVYIAAGSGGRGSAPELSSQEVFRLGTDTAPTASPTNLNFGQAIVTSGAVTRKVLVGNPGLQNVTLAAIVITGSSDYAFAFGTALPFVLQPGQSTEINVTFTPTAAGGKSAQLEVTHSGVNGKLTIALTGEGIEAGIGAQVLYRVNAGGPQLPAADGSSPDWSADNAGQPSPYVTNGKFFTTTKTITKDASVPASVPVSLFQTEHWDSGAPGDPISAEMQWDFPVTVGKSIEVRLYFAEVYLTAQNNSTQGPRIFDVAVDGAVPPIFDNIDIFAAAGSNVGIMRALVTTSDGNLDLDFIHVAQNPALKGIEIIDRSTPNQTPTVVAPLADRSVNQDSPAATLNLADVFNDAEQGKNLVFSVPGNSAPDLVTPSLNGATLTLTYAPGKFGVATLTVRATDNNSTFAEDTFVVNINGKPALAALADRSVNENSTLNVIVSATDPENKPLTLTASSLPKGAIFTDNGNGLGTLSWSTSFEDAGVYDVTLTATDALGALATKTLKITVNNVNRPPVVAVINSQVVNEGASLNIPVTASDPDHNDLTLTATGVPAGAVFSDNGSGAGVFTWNAVAPINGVTSFVITVRATDNNGLFAERTFTIVIGVAGNQPPVITTIDDQSVAAGNILNMTIAAIDPDGAGEAIVLTMSGLPGNATFTDQRDGSATLVWSPQADQIGTFTVTITATDGDNLQTTQSFMVTVLGGASGINTVYIPIMRK